MTRSIPPKSDELEISIIGPGRGECILVHLGNNEWCIADSCIARTSNEAVALEYLRGFQNGALEGVKLIVATHWHDDHIRGLASILRQVPNARFGCSSALKTDEFMALVGTVPATVQGRSGVDELASILELLVTNRAPGKPKELVAPLFAIENRRLILLTPGKGRSFPASVTALSPSDGAVKLALAEIANLIPRPGETQRRIINRSPNHASVVLWIEAGERRALLGADLEQTNRAGEGWIAVLTCHQDSAPAAVFKVPHHGSQNADCPDVWSKMLVGSPIAVVTPFTGGTRLPRQTDLDRLSARTTHLYCTSMGPGKPPSRDPVVEKTARRIVSERRVIEGKPGHVRVRCSVTDGTSAPVVEVFNGAYRVEGAQPVTD
jgi:hypothetical protein